MKSDLRFVEDTFVLSFPLPDPDPELQFLTNLRLMGGAEDTGTPWASIAGEARAGEAGTVERPGNFLPPNILGKKRVEGTEKPAEAFGVDSTAVGVGVGRFPGVGVPGELETAWITS